MSPNGFTPVPMGEKNAKFQYLNKDRHNRVNVCSDRDFPPAALTQKIEKKKFESQIANKIAWITNTYLEYYGVLVIDGLDLAHDWLNDDNLFGNLVGLPKESVFWFSAPDHLSENAALLGFILAEARRKAILH